MTGPMKQTTLASLAQQIGSLPAPRTASRPARSADQRPATWDTSFETLPAYQTMARQRALAELVGVENPYYRLHDARAGATAVIDGRERLNFASYDYLGLNAHPEVLEAAAEALSTWGSGVSASRMTAGERPLHRELERELAEVYDADDAVVFVSGHATAVSTIAALMGPRDLVLYDALVHNCVVVGAQLSGATRRSTPHNDLDALAAMLERDRDRFERVLIVTEGLFSMDGDGGDLRGLIDLKTRFGCWLMVDDAHGLGVLGARGYGAGEHAEIDPRQVDLWMGTLSKALVSCGGYVAGCQAVIDLLKLSAPGLVYSVGLPMPSAAASLTALQIMRREPERVQALHRNSRQLWESARAGGFDTGTSWGYGITPIVIGDTLTAVMLSQRLLARGVNAFPILPPGVPEHTARLRFFVSTLHSPEQIATAMAVLAEESAALSREGGGLAGLARIAPSRSGGG